MSISRTVTSRPRTATTSCAENRVQCFHFRAPPQPPEHRLERRRQLSPGPRALLVAQNRQPDAMPHRAFDHHRPAVDHPHLETEGRAGAHQVQRHLFAGHAGDVAHGLQLIALGALDHHVAQHPHRAVPGCRDRYLGCDRRPDMSTSGELRKRFFVCLLPCDSRRAAPRQSRSQARCPNLTAALNMAQRVQMQGLRRFQQIRQFRRITGSLVGAKTLACETRLHRGQGLRVIEPLRPRSGPLLESAANRCNDCPSRTPATSKTNF